MIITTFAATTATATKTSLENKHAGNGAYFVVIASSSHPLLIVDGARFKWTGRSVVEVNVDDERFTVVCSRCG